MSFVKPSRPSRADSMGAGLSVSARNFYSITVEPNRPTYILPAQFCEGTVSNHFQIKRIMSSGVRQVLQVEEFADRYDLDAKQRRDLVALFGQFASVQELLTNCRLPAKCR